MTKAFDQRLKNQRLQIFAEEYNKFIQTSRRVDESIINSVVPKTTLNTEKQIIHIQNDSGVDIDQYMALSMNDLLFIPSANEQGFKFRFGFKGKVYKQSQEDTENPLIFAITQQGIAPGGLGKAMTNGTTQARIVVNDNLHQYVRLDDNNPVLQSSIWGEARILYKEPGVGEKWAVIQMATSDSQRVQVVNNSPQTIPEGGAMQVTGVTGPGRFTVGLPDKDNLLHVIPLTGPALQTGFRRWIDFQPMMRFRINPNNQAKIVPGSNIGVVENSFELDISRFGFMVYGVEIGTPGAPYAYCGLNGIVSLLTAVGDEAEGKIPVQRSDVTGTGDGDTFELDVIAEEE